MTDEEIRASLFHARGAIAPFTEEGHIVVSRDRVTADDLDEVDRWVMEKGGEIRTVPGSESQLVSTGAWQRGPSTEPSAWYVIPAGALGLDR
jgi:hypothetical protein